MSLRFGKVFEMKYYEDMFMIKEFFIKIWLVLTLYNLLILLNSEKFSIIIEFLNFQTGKWIPICRIYADLLWNNISGNDSIASTQADS